MESQPLEISDDALKMLVAENGVRGTARMLGMDQRQTDAFRQRVTRGKWLSDPHIAAMRAKASPTITASPVVAKVSPTAAIHNELVAIGQQTRLALAQGVSKAAEHVKTLDGAAIIADAGNVKAVAQTADILHGYKDAAPQVKIRLDVLNGGAEPLIDIGADVTPLEQWVSEVDPLDEY